MTDSTIPEFNPLLFGRNIDPFSGEALNNNVNPNNPIKKVYIEYKDDKINPYFQNYLLKDFASTKSVKDIHKNLSELYTKLQKTGIYKKLNVSFQPGPEPDTFKVVFEPEKKNRVSGSFDQQISRSGSFVQEGKLTIRNVFGLLDQLSIEAGKGWGGDVLESYHLKYTLPIFYKDYSLDLSFEKAFRDLIPTVKEESAGKSVTVFNENMYFKLSDTLKLNFVDLVQHSKEALEHEILPLRRVSFKAGRIWNNIYEINKEYGQRTELSGEISVGKGGSALGKIEFNNHSFINPDAFEYKKKIKHLNFENYFNVGLTVPLSRSRLRINDRFFSYNLRGFSEVASIHHLYDKILHPMAGMQGFERLGEYAGDDAYIKNTIKLNFNHFPHLREGGAVPFIYYSCAFLSGSLMNRNLGFENRPVNLLNELKENTRHSVGFGIAKAFGPVKLELLLNMFAKGKATDKFARFQLRISATD